MPAIAGRKTVVYIALAAAGPWVIVKGINQMSLSIDGQLIDVSEFGATWKDTLRGLLDASFTMSGNYRPDDTTGQKVLRDNYIADTDTYLKVLVDGASGFSFMATFTKFNPDSGVDAKVGLQIAGNQSGGITFIDA